MDGVSESRNKGWRGADSEVRKFREGGMESKTKENRTAGKHKKKKTNKQKKHNTMASMTGNQQNHEIITKKHEKCNNNEKMASM